MAMVGFALSVLASCAAEEPRAVTFFQKNGDERQTVLVGCQSGEHRGRECDNAREAEKLVRRAEREKQNRDAIRSWNTIR